LSFCNVTIEGTFHSRIIPKTNNLLIGNINRASTDGASCVGGTWTILSSTLAWHIRYNGFAGTLPNVTGVRIAFIAFAIGGEVGFGLHCLYQSSSAQPFYGIGQRSAGGVITGLRADENAPIPGVTGFPCSASASLANTAGVTVAGATTAVTLRLI
jgi:hypothetical protein